VQKSAPAEAEKWFARLVAAGVTPSFLCFHHVIEAYCSRGQIGQALTWLDRLEAAGFRGSDLTFCALLNASRDSRQQAERIMQRMTQSQVKPSIAIVNAVIDVYAQAGNPGLAERYFDEALAAGLVPDGFTYGILIHANASQPERAASWFRRMCKSGVKPNVVTYSSMIKAYATLVSTATPAEVSRLVGLAEDWYQRMLNDGVAPSLHTYTTLISLYSRVSRPDRAARTFIQLIDSGLQPNVFTYTALIGSFANMGELDFAAKVFQRMVQHGVQPNEKTYLRMLWACVHAKKPAAMLDWLADMQKRGVIRTSATCVLVHKGISLLRQRRMHDQADAMQSYLVPQEAKPSVDVGDAPDGGDPDDQPLKF
jgi:pentatricopeptide repeat protein